MAFRQKYFYTILFLDDYYPERKHDETTQKPFQTVEVPVLKEFTIKSPEKTTISENLYWKNGVLYVKPNLKFPLTAEMWNAEEKPIFYCPILKKGIESISVGHVVIEENNLLAFYFTEDNPPPEGNEEFKLAVKTLPSFDTESVRLSDLEKDTKTINRALDEIISTTPIGMAIIFRRHSIDALMDLIVDFDETYWHSLAEGSDLKYLTQKSMFQTCRFTTKYTSELQDVLDLIDTSLYEIKFSWQS